MKKIHSSVAIVTEQGTTPEGSPAPQSPRTSPLQRNGSQVTRRTASTRQLGKKKSSASIAQRMELARRRTEAALMIQRAWHRWYVSLARRKRIEAAKVIQHAWAGTFHIANARRELQFLRWLRKRRASQRQRWKVLLHGLEQRRLWAFVVIAAFKNVCIWRRRLVVRRHNRFALRLQRWWRQLRYDRKTRGAVLMAMEWKELLKLESTMRTAVVKVYRTSFAHVAFSGRELLDEGQARTLKRWHEENRVPYDAHPVLAAALTRYETRWRADHVRHFVPSAEPSKSTVAAPPDASHKHQRRQEDSSSMLPEYRGDVVAAPAVTPRLVPTRPLSSRGRPQETSKFSIAVRPPSATVRNSRRPQRAQ